MSTEEKLHLMDILWHEISLDEEKIEVRQHHIEMLDKRAEMIRKGDAVFLDWEDAKKQIEQSAK